MAVNNQFHQLLRYLNCIFTLQVIFCTGWFGLFGQIALYIKVPLRLLRYFSKKLQLLIWNWEPPSPKEAEYRVPAWGRKEWPRRSPDPQFVFRMAKQLCINYLLMKKISDISTFSSSSKHVIFPMCVRKEEVHVSCSHFVKLAATTLNHFCRKEWKIGCWTKVNIAESYSLSVLIPFPLLYGGQHIGIAGFWNTM